MYFKNATISWYFQCTYLQCMNIIEHSRVIRKSSYQSWYFLIVSFYHILCHFERYSTSQVSQACLCLRPDNAMYESWHDQTCTLVTLGWLVLLLTLSLWLSKKPTITRMNSLLVVLHQKSWYRFSCPAMPPYILWLATFIKFIGN